MIPKIIHYCWFGGKKIPDELQEYINTWKTYCPDYKLVLWNEDSFNIDSNSFTQSAYKAKKFAYVSGYVRAYALYTQGGIYLDTDIEVKAPLDIFLQHEAFSGFESSGAPFTAVWGAKPNHTLSKIVLDFYQDRVYTPNENTNTVEVGRMLIDKFNIDPNNNHLQIGEYLGDSMHIYPSSTFCLDLPRNYTTHHFYGSWLPNKVEFKNIVSGLYLKEQLQQNFYNIDTKDLLKFLAKKITFTQLLKFIRYYISNLFCKKSN